MAVFRWGNPWIDFSDLEREVDRLLHSVNISMQGLRLGRQYPPLNLYELEDQFLITAELPGVRPEHLELTIAGGILTLSGSRESAAKVPDQHFRRQERFRGHWQRSVSIPERVNEEAMTAEFHDGILTIHLPKAEETRARPIRVLEGDH